MWTIAPSAANNRTVASPIPEAPPVTTITLSRTLAVMPPERLSWEGRRMALAAKLSQAWPRPTEPRPIAVVGAGGVVESAHLPAYRRLGLPVAALFDIDRERAERVAARFEVPRVHTTLGALAAEPGVVFDLAVPARAVLSVLEALPEGSTVLIQKPMGETLAEAQRIVEACHRRRFVAAVNFQLRFAPNMLALSELVRSGALGRVVDFEVRVNVHTPWDDWPFLAGIPRHEVLYHSVHYLDLARSLLGEPKGVLSKPVRHPSLPAYSDTRSVTILDYGSELRAFVAAFHGHK